jgi:hypothetical protein
LIEKAGIRQPVRVWCSGSAGLWLSDVQGGWGIRLMDNSQLVYSTESGKICPSCQKPVSKCTCKKKRPRSQTNIKYDGTIRIQREVKGRKCMTVTTLPQRCKSRRALESRRLRVTS